MKDDLIKSIDGLIDDLFSEDEATVEKSMIKDHKPQDETADEAKAKTPGYGQDDDKRGAGRPKQISDVPKTDTDGKRAKDYDDAIAEKNENGKKKEDDQVTPPKDMKKSDSEEEKVILKSDELDRTTTLTKSEWEEFRTWKAEKQELAKSEEMKKAEAAQADLIKSAVLEATKGLKEENDALKKSLEEQGELIKAVANKPQRKKSVTNIEALEKSGSKNSNQPSAAEQKAVALDVAEELVKSGKLSLEHAVELENTGFIYDAEPRRVLEVEVKKELNKRYR